MKCLRLRNAPASIAVALALSAIAVPGYSAVISAGDVQRNDPTTLLVGAISPGSLTVNGGTTLDRFDPSFGASNAVVIGAVAGSSGTGIVSGAGSTWIVGAMPNVPTGSFTVGSFGTGSLTAEQGGTLIGTQLNVGGSAAGGTVNIVGSGSRGQFSEPVAVGTQGTGALNVSNGGVLTSLALFAGLSAGSNGTATISGTGSVIQSTNNINIGDSGVGRLNINQGGALTASLLVVGNNASGNGVVNIDGTGSTAQIQSSVTVGFAGSGTLNVSNTGLLNGLQLFAGASAGSNGVVNVTGSNSRVQLQGAAVIGQSSAGALNVTNGGLLTGTQLVVGGSASSNGIVTIDGVGSRIETTGLSLVGPNSASSLSITNGGRFISTFSASNQSALTLGSNSGGNGTVTVSGLGSKIEGRGIITVGLNPGPNTVGNLNITNGGVVEEAALQSGFGAGATGNIAVSGAGSLLHLSSFSNQQTFMNIGRLGTGLLNVTAGGKVLMDPSAANATLNSFNVLNIGGGAGNVAGATNGAGTVNVSGSGSEIRLKGNFSSINVGRNGMGVLSITNGGQVINENLTGATFSTVGRSTGANGTALVSGAGSLWQAGNKLFIGTEVTANASGGTEAPGGGTGVLTVSNGGKVVAGSDIIIGAGGTVKGSGGTLQGNVINKGNISPGNSPGILTIVGNLTLTATGNLNIELGGVSNANMASPLYDQIMVLDDAATTAQEGQVVVDGNVNVLFLTGFDPDAGDFFDILSAADITQLNPLYNLPTLDAGLRWEINELAIGGGEVLRLSVIGPTVAVPEPGAFALLGIGLLGLGALRRQRR